MAQPEATVRAASAEDIEARPSSHRIRVAGVTMLQGDCLDLIPLLPDGCVDVVVTSPPYWGSARVLGHRHGALLV